MKGKQVKFLIILIATLIVAAIVYRYNPYRVSFLGHYDKIWAHRVNSTEKLEYALKHFEGVELDLVYLSEKNVLDVNHPPALSSGLTFEAYLAKIEENTYPFMWLDIKNLNSENTPKIFDKLVTLLDSKNYPLQKILIETRFPEALPKFTDAGFLTSYYLPSGLSKTEGDNLQMKISAIDSVLTRQPTIGISTSYIDYEVVSRSFPKKKKYLWILNHSKIKEHSLVRTILKDTTVKVVLAPYRPL